MSEPADSAPFSFVEMEHDILKLWQDTDAFQQSRHTQGKTVYFLRWPAVRHGFAASWPLVASTIKDVVPRYWTMKGRYVMRRFGWDCHGLPIEYEIDKQLGMSAQDAVEKLEWLVTTMSAEPSCSVTSKSGVAPLLGSVAGSTLITTIRPWTPGTWSLWWVFKQLWDKGLIYQGVKVVPVSTALGTPLANFEAPRTIKMFKTLPLPFC